MSDSDRIKNWLWEDLGTDDLTETDTLLHFMHALRTVSETRPDKMEAVRNALLMQFEAARTQKTSRLQNWIEKFKASLFWLLLRSQVRIVKSEIWLATLLVMTIGTLVTLSQDTPSGATHPLVMFAPLVAAGGIAFLYGSNIDPPLEILMTMPVTPRLVLLARLFLVFGFNLCLGVLSSIVFLSVPGDFTLSALIVAWLVPMTFLSALAFFIAAMTREPILGAFLSFILWILQFFDLAYLRYPDLAAPDYRLILLILAGLLGGASMWLAGQEDYWVGGEHTV